MRLLLLGALAAGGLALTGCGESHARAARAPRPLATATGALPTRAPRAGLVLAGEESAHRITAKDQGPLSEIEHGPRTRRLVALTFDADMTALMLRRLRAGLQRSWYDGRIVRVLERTRTPATIFLTGLWTSTYPAVVRRLARNPLFELENHSVDHAGWLAPCYGLPLVLGAISKREEIEDAARTIHAVAGVVPRFFRFPGGCHDAADLRLLASFHERAVGWDVVSGDPFQPDPAVIVRAVLGGVRPGSIVVMHLIGAPNAPATAGALPRIIAGLRARGYRFVTLRRLLRR